MQSAIARVPTTIAFVDIDGVERSFDVRRFSLLEVLQMRAFADAIEQSYGVTTDEGLKAQFGLLIIATVAFRQTDKGLTFDDVANWFDATSISHIDTLIAIATAVMPATGTDRGNGDAPAVETTTG